MKHGFGMLLTEKSDEKSQYIGYFKKNWKDGFGVMIW